MSLYDLYEGKKESSDDKWLEVDGVWACPECDAQSDDCYYDNDEGVVGKICDEHPNATIFIGRGRA